MNKLSKMLSVTALAVSVVACGGGGGSAGTSPFGSGGTPGGCTPSAASGAAGTCAAAAASLALQLDVPTIDDSGASSVKATATALTSSGQALTGVPITFSVDNNAAFSVGSTSTAANGQLVATVTTGADPSNRIVTVTATSGSLTATSSFAVTGAKLTGTRSKANVLPGEAAKVDFHLTNSNGIAMVGLPFTVTAGSLPSLAGVTDVSGNFTYSFTAPTTTGAFDVIANAGGISNTQTITVSTVSTVPVIDLTSCPGPAPACPILSASVSANPSVVSTNSAGTSNRTEIRALFVGAGNKPIANVRVRFDLENDPSAVGGSFSAGDNTPSGDKSVVLTDANGIATTAYIPADRASPTNGVTVRACYGGNDAFLVCNPANSAKTTLTVVADPLAVTIGSNEKVYIGPNDLTYIRKFVILVVDASGRAKGNVDIIPSIDLDRYYKGAYVHGATWFTGYYNSATPSVATSSPVVECFNEDINRNAVNEVLEDINHTGTLEPRKSDVAVSVVGSGRTDSSGSALVQIEYPKNIATWARVKILISATGVSGTEGRATWTEVLPAEVTAFTSAGAPAFFMSPYGAATFSGVVGTSASGKTITYTTHPEPTLRGPYPFSYPDGTVPVTGDVVAPCGNPN